MTEASTDRSKPQEESTSSFLDKTFSDANFSRIDRFSVTPLHAGHSLIRRHAKFRIDALSDDRVIRMYGLSSQLMILKDRVKDMLGKGEQQQAILLQKQLNFINNEGINRSKETNIEYLMKQTFGSSTLTAAFLGIKSPLGPSWIEFIVRSWGKAPGDYKQFMS